MPIWKQMVRVGDVFHDDEMTLPEKGKVIVERLRKVREEGVDLDFDGILLELGDAAEADDTAWFDGVWTMLYDWADEDHRLWIETIDTSPATLDQ